MTMKYLKGICAIVPVVLLFTSCKRNNYTCWCQVKEVHGARIEELQLGYMSNDRAQKKCNDYEYARGEELRGTTTSLNCKVINEQ